MDDIKLDKHLFEGPIEIQKFDDTRRQRLANGEELTDTIQSESDLSHVVRHKEQRLSIEIFKGSDPMFNCQNLYLRIRGMTRTQMCKISLLMLIILACTISIALWFKIKLNGYAAK